MKILSFLHIKRRFFTCLTALLLISSNAFLMTALADNGVNHDVIDFSPKPVLDKINQSDLANITFYYHYSEPVKYNGVDLTWYFPHGFFRNLVVSTEYPDSAGDLNKYINFYQKSNYCTVRLPNKITQDWNGSTMVVTDWILNHKQRTGSGSAVNYLNLKLVSTALKPSTAYVIKIKKGFTFNNSEQTTTSSIFYFTTTAAASNHSPTVHSSASSSIRTTSRSPSSYAHLSSSTNLVGTLSSVSSSDLSHNSVSSRNTISSSGSSVSNSLNTVSSSVSAVISSEMIMNSPSNTSDKTEAKKGFFVIVTVVLSALVVLAAAVRISWALIKKYKNKH